MWHNGWSVQVVLFITYKCINCAIISNGDIILRNPFHSPAQCGHRNRSISARDEPDPYDLSDSNTTTAICDPGEFLTDDEFDTFNKLIQFIHINVTSSTCPESCRGKCHVNASASPIVQVAVGIVDYLPASANTPDTVPEYAKSIESHWSDSPNKTDVCDHLLLIMIGWHDEIMVLEGGDGVPMCRFAQNFITQNERLIQAKNFTQVLSSFLDAYYETLIEHKNNNTISYGCDVISTKPSFSINFTKLVQFMLIMAVSLVVIVFFIYIVEHMLWPEVPAVPKEKLQFIPLINYL